MMSWKSMDERERAVWSATVAAAFVRVSNERRGFKQPTIGDSMSESIVLADAAVEALREKLKNWPFGETP